MWPIQKQIHGTPRGQLTIRCTLPGPTGMSVNCVERGRRSVKLSAHRILEILSMQDGVANQEPGRPGSSWILAKSCNIRQMARHILSDMELAARMRTWAGSLETRPISSG